LDKRKKISNKGIKKNKGKGIDKLGKKRLKMAIDNKEKCFGGVPMGHHSRQHIEEMARQRDLKQQKIKKAMSIYAKCIKCGNAGLTYRQHWQGDFILCINCGKKMNVKKILKGKI
jgi:hypothetical protein